MNQNRLGVELQKEAFGVLYPLIEDEEITDIDYNGRDIWVTDIYNECRKLDISLTDLFVEKFCTAVANAVSEPFNPGNPYIESESDRLRISVGHETIAKTGRTICIRKSSPSVRIKATEAVESGYCPKELLYFLVNCILAGMRFVVCGLPGDGKTELVKFLMQFIPKQERVITIEDNLELHYCQINPDANGVELKVSDTFTYSDAIRFSMRQHPKRLVLSEARGEEVKELIEAWSTGVTGLSTLHADSVLNIPDRLLNMMPYQQDEKRLLNDIYQYVDIGISVRLREENGKKQRVIDQVCIYDRADRKNSDYLLLDERELVSREIPDNLMRKFYRSDIRKPWICPRIDEELAKEKEGCRV